MPFATNQGVKIWWQEEGEGEPVLAIMGLSFPLEMWHRTAPRLSRHYRVILMDNRGVGRSDSPEGPYFLWKMADDAAAVLDAAGVTSAHVMGASMGGMIAQELALRHPARVRSLMLGCTWCGGLRAARPQLREFLKLAGYNRLSAEEKMRALIPLLYTPRTPPDRIEEDLTLRLRSVPSQKGYHNQILGMMVWSSWSRLPRIRQPAMIMHGELDRLVPPKNAQILASRLPDARMIVIPDAGHVFSTDQPELANREVLAFLAEMENGRSAERPPVS